MKPWHLVREPSHSQRGSSAGSHTPRRQMVCSQLRFISCVRLRSALCPTTALKIEPSSAQSPFARCRRYRHLRDVCRLLRGHYSPVIALTDSCVDPTRSPLLRPKPRSRSLCRLRPAPAAGGTFPTLFSVNPSLRAWAPVTAVPWSAHACFFLHVIGLPPYTIEVGFPLVPVKTIS